MNWGQKPPDFDIVINTTSLGLKENDKIDIDFKDCENKLFYDVIYNPSQTKFLSEAEKNFQNETKNGLAMFVFQAQESFKIWHGFAPDINEKIYKMLRS